MAERTKEIVKRGTWLYDSAVPCEVWIIRQNFFECPTPDDEEKTPGYPPCDADGYFYYVTYALAGAVRSVSRLCSSTEEAVRLVRATLRGPISWTNE